MQEHTLGRLDELAAAEQVAVLNRQDHRLLQLLNHVIQAVDETGQVKSGQVTGQVKGGIIRDHFIKTP